MNADGRRSDGERTAKSAKDAKAGSGLHWWDELLQTKRYKEAGARLVREIESEKAEAEAKKAEEMKAEELKRARHGAWLKCHIALCAEVGAPGNPRTRNLERWISRLAGVNAMGFAALQDIREMIRGLHLDQARALLRLALATNVVALYSNDPEVVEEQAKVEVKKEGDGGGKMLDERCEMSEVGKGKE